MNQQEMQYLGDGVYCGHDGYQIWLTTGSHENPELLAIEPLVIQNLVNYARAKLGVKIV